MPKENDNQTLYAIDVTPEMEAPIFCHGYNRTLDLASLLNLGLAPSAKPRWIYIAEARIRPNIDPSLPVFDYFNVDRI